MEASFSSSASSRSVNPPDVCAAAATSAFGLLQVPAQPLDYLPRGILLFFFLIFLVRHVAVLFVRWLFI
jgi:hypothetical protein